MTADFDWVGPYRGPCGVCGGPDARHRTADAILDRVAAGGDRADVAADYEIDEHLIPRSCENPVLIERERWEEIVSAARGVRRLCIPATRTTYSESGLGDAIDVLCAAVDRINTVEDR